MPTRTVTPVSEKYLRRDALNSSLEISHMTTEFGGSPSTSTASTESVISGMTSIFCDVLYNNVCLEFQIRLFKKIEFIQEQNKQILAALKNSSTANKISTLPESSPQLPINNLEILKEFELYLENNNNFTLLVCCKCVF